MTYEETRLASLRQTLREFDAVMLAQPRPLDQAYLASYCYATGQLASEIAQIERDLGIRQELIDDNTGEVLTGRLHQRAQRMTVSWARGWSIGRIMVGV